MKIVLQQCQNNVSFKRKDSGIVSNFHHIFQKIESALHLINRKCCQPCEIISKNFNTTPEPFFFLETYFILTFLENNGSAVFEATINFAFSLP